MPLGMDSASPASTRATSKALDWTTSSSTASSQGMSCSPQPLSLLWHQPVSRTKALLSGHRHGSGAADCGSSTGFTIFQVSSSDGNWSSRLDGTGSARPAAAAGPAVDWASS